MYQSKIWFQECNFQKLAGVFLSRLEYLLIFWCASIKRFDLCDWLTEYCFSKESHWSLNKTKKVKDLWTPELYSVHGRFSVSTNRKPNATPNWIHRWIMLVMLTILWSKARSLWLGWYRWSYWSSWSWWIC